MCAENPIKSAVTTSKFIKPTLRPTAPTPAGHFSVLHGKLVGANKGLGEALKSCTRKEHESATNSIAKRGQGAMPLAGSRDSVPCGVWGNAPTVPRPTNPNEAANKGAGSEASLPVTLRVRRRAPKLLFPQDSVKNPHNSAFRISLHAAPCSALNAAKSACPSSRVCISAFPCAISRAYR